MTATLAAPAYPTRAAIPPVTPAGFKDLGVAYMLLIWLGTLGAHKFYLGRTGMGILYLCTFGVFGIGVLVDIFTLTTQTREANARIAQRGF